MSWMLRKKWRCAFLFLQKANFVTTPPPCDISDYVQSIVKAAGDRIQIAGDVLQFDDFFVADEELVYDEKAFEKRIRKPEGAVQLLMDLREGLSNVDPFDAESTEVAVKGFVEEQGIKIGQIINALRVAVTGKGVGFGTFDTLAILGKDRCLNRIDLAVARAKNSE